MLDWLGTVGRVEPLEDVEFDEALVADMAAYWEKRGSDQARVNFYTPTFKAYQSSEIASCGKNAWPAMSITGAECKLQCDHCKSAILEPMVPVTTPEMLWRKVSEVVEQGAEGMLLTGGSNHRNEVEYGPFWSTVRRIKDEYPHFKIACHTALVDEDQARSMEQAGIDAAMMDVIGAQDTITQVYHLKRTVDDFEATLETLVKTNMKVVPHIVVGLHYGHLLGEWNALEMLQRHLPDAVVLVVVMPQYAPEKRPFVTPDTDEVGRFFLDAREALPDTPLLLGCARPSGLAKMKLDAYAVMAGMSGIAHPADGAVELAARLERRVKITNACCSIAVGEEVMAMEDADHSLELDLETIIEHERRMRTPFGKPSGGLAGIKVIAG